MSIDEHEIKKRGQLIAVQRSLIVVAAVMGLIFMTVASLDSISGLQDRARLIDCTEPQGECYQRSQQRTGEAIQAIINEDLKAELATREVVVVAAWCANRSHRQSLAQIEQCIKQELEE